MRNRRLLYFLSAFISLLCAINYIPVYAEDSETLEIVTVGDQEIPDQNNEESSEEDPEESSEEDPEETYEEDPEESSEEDPEESSEEDPEESSEEDPEESSEEDQVVNCSYSADDLQDLEDKLDDTNSLLLYIMYSIWSCTGLYMGSKLLKGLFNE